MTDSVPVFDLRAAAAELAPRLLDRWRGVVADTAFVGGREVAAFEQAWSAYLGAGGCVGVANGTDALVVALRALGVGPGDEVIVPAFTFFATAEAVALVGATPVVCDVDAATLQMDLADAAGRVGPRTRGLLPVHLYGQPCDLDAVERLCAAHGLWYVEDAAQAHGALWRGRRVGTFGRLAAWSFYPSKNLGCFGDGGAVTGGDAELLERVRSLANHGRMEHYRHGAIGLNSRLDGLQAAVLGLRLPLLERDNARRRQLAAAYRERLSGVGDLGFQAVPPEAEGVYHQLTVRTARREGLRAHLAAQGIGSAVHYPVPLHRQPALEGIAPAVDLPVAELAAETVLSLPMYPQLTDEQLGRVCDEVRSYFAG